MALKVNWDALGITASMACAIHCAVLPLLGTAVPILGIDIVDNVKFEYFMIFLALGIGSYSLIHGYKKHHHRLLPLYVFLVGITLLFGKQYWHELQLWFLVPAVVTVIVAHYLNFRYCKKANHCHAQDCAH